VTPPHPRSPVFPATLLLATVVGCRQPTQLVVEVETDLQCKDNPRTSIALGQLGGLSEVEFSAESSTCTPINDSSGILRSRLGTVVLVPSGSENGRVAFELLTSIGSSTPADCQAAQRTGGAAFAKCIAARRSLHFSANQSVTIHVPMDVDCFGVNCLATETCKRASCMPADCDTDPTTCFPADGTAGSSGAGGSSGLGPGTTNSLAACSVSYTIGDSTIAQQPTVTVSGSVIDITYRADLAGLGLSWVTEHRNFDGSRATTPTVVPIPTGVTTLGPMLPTTTGTVLLGMNSTDVGIYAVDSSTGLVTSNLAVEATYVMTREGLHDLGTEYGFGAASILGSMVFITAPKSLASHTVHSLTAPAASSNLCTSWDGSQVVATFIAGGTNLVRLARATPGTWTWDYSDVSDGTSTPSTAYHARGSTNLLVVWDEPDGAGGNQVAAQLMSTAGVALAAKVVVGTGTSPIATFNGTNYDVAWLQLSGGSTGLTRQTVSTSGALLASPSVIIAAAPTQSVRATTSSTGQQILSWWDDSSQTVQLTVCP
jgi:hypothetical protein